MRTVSIKMDPGKDVETFLANLEIDSFLDVIAHGEVDPNMLSVCPPNLTQIWRFMQMLRIQLKDIRECLELILPKPKVQKKRKSVAPKRKKKNVDEIAQ